MTVQDTSEIIRRLTASASPVRRLASPGTRATWWCATALLYLAAIDWLLLRSSFTFSTEGRFVLEQTAALATGIAAAVAAFASVVPGHSQRLALVPLLPLTVWIASIGQACVYSWSSTIQLPPILDHWGCFPLTVLVGSPPAAVIVLMLRRGAPLSPRMTTALSALAVAGLANVALRFVHRMDASVVVLIWHIGAVFGFSLLVTVVGDRFFQWRHSTATQPVRSARNGRLRHE